MSHSTTTRRTTATSGLFLGMKVECSKEHEPAETIRNVTVGGLPIDVEMYDDVDDERGVWAGPNDYFPDDPHPSHSSQIAVGLGKLRRLGKRLRDQHLDEEADHQTCFEARRMRRKSRSIRKPPELMN